MYCVNKNDEIVLIFCLFWVLSQSEEFLYRMFGSNGDFPSWNRSHDPARAFLAFLNLLELLANQKASLRGVLGFEGF